VPKDKDGFITAELLGASLGDLNNYDFLICGPPMMMRALGFQLKAAGVHEDKIHIEDFSM
jgi:ferredoxin-NADP reductase